MFVTLKLMNVTAARQPVALAQPALPEAGGVKLIQILWPAVTRVKLPSRPNMVVRLDITEPEMSKVPEALNSTEKFVMLPADAVLKLRLNTAGVTAAEELETLIASAVSAADCAKPARQARRIAEKRSFLKLKLVYFNDNPSRSRRLFKYTTKVWQIKRRINSTNPFKPFFLQKPFSANRAANARHLKLARLYNRCRKKGEAFAGLRAGLFRSGKK